ncbi:hypothetical protein BB559_001596 [Furculomyces boomerangus]|uniref:EIPR1-like beta-propeller domain-containing protein n=2 Tax=Harpellales TaxID=61421 RepID=A0A2T9Z1J7_9FUNG|nr:hypothetical protein BB559_001596 [Furculomyces boomerangus]PWA01073.1 hypothetical protein BB558_002879 [Smittium angustum]
MESQAKVYGVDRQARCITSIANSDEKSEFLIGTIGLDKKNKIHLLQIDDEEGELSSQIFDHEEEIWDIQSAPWDPSLIFTVHSDYVDEKWVRAASAFKLVTVEDNSSDYYSDQTGEVLGGSNFRSSLLPLTKLKTGQDSGLIQKIVFGKHLQDPKRFGILGFNTLSLWDFEGNGTIKKINSVYDPNKTNDGFDQLQQNTQLFDAKFIGNGNVAILGQSNGKVVGVDVRSDNSNKDFSIGVSRWGNIISVDGNPNIEYQIVTGGEDGIVRIFDLRNNISEISSNSVENSEHGNKLLEIGDYTHTHWVCSVEYNHFHDQLVLSSGSDARVNMHSIYSVSSANTFVNYLSQNNNSNDPKTLNVGSQNGKNTGFDDDMDLGYDIAESEFSGFSQNNSPKENGFDTTVNDSWLNPDNNTTDSGSDSNYETFNKNDGLVAHFDDHETSVYRACWSKTNPWLFTSLSLDGRVVVNYVPKSEKYKILL